MNKILFTILTIFFIGLNPVYSGKDTNYITELQEYCNHLAGEDTGTFIIAMDPATGSIRALTDPDTGIKKKYSPGSVIKPVFALIALESNLVTPFMEINCEYVYQVGNREYLCSWAEGHGRVNMRRAIAVSCNIYFYKLARELGFKEFSKGMKDFKINQKTGIDIQGEEESEIPDSVDEDTFLNLAIGMNSEFRITPVKLIQTLNIIPNQGMLVTPRNYKHSPVNRQKLFPWDKDVHGEILRGMQDCIKSGTGKQFKIKPTQVAGKTGTSPVNEDIRGENIAFFYCFYPVENPEISILVIHKHGYGSTTALPIAEKVLEKYLEIKSHNH